jgi:hypothetical protein
MRAPSSILLAAFILAATMPLLLRADEYLKNTDFKEGISCWRGDGHPVFLKPDGTEGDEQDTGVIPVIKLELSKSNPRAVYQEYETHDTPGTQHLRVEVYASSDFKRSTFPNDYSQDINWKPGGVWYWSGEAVPNVDFWIRGAPGYLYKMANLKPSQWVTVDGFWDQAQKAEDRAVCFFVPPGTGTVYIKNPSAKP